MQDIESFLNTWVERVNQLDTTTKESNGGFRERVREFELRKKKWEEECEAEAKVMQQKSEDLINAWLDLEEEQRRFLQLRESKSFSKRLPALDSDLACLTQESEPISEDVDEMTPSLASPSGRASNQCRPGSVSGQIGQSSAVQQFEQLRREIKSNREQRRQV